MTNPSKHNWNCWSYTTTHQRFRSFYRSRRLPLASWLFQPYFPRSDWWVCLLKCRSGSDISEICLVSMWVMLRSGKSELYHLSRTVSESVVSVLIRKQLLPVLKHHIQWISIMKIIRNPRCIYIHACIYIDQDFWWFWCIYIDLGLYYIYTDLYI